MTDFDFRQKIVFFARRWIGTPYVHQASTKGAGTDCLGLIRGVWRDVYGSEPEAVPPYARDWGETSDEEPMLEAANRWFIAIGIGEAKPGDLLCFRWRPGMTVRHLGIMTQPERFIHAYEKAGTIETGLVSHWKKRVAFAFQFPKPDQLKNT